MEIIEFMKNLEKMKFEIGQNIQNLAINFATNIKDSDFIEYLKNNFTDQQIVIGGTIITFILLLLFVILFIVIVFKVGKILEKKGIIIDFSLKDFFGAWGIIFLIIDILFTYEMIKLGFDASVIPAIIFMLIFGIYGIYQQKSKIELYKNCGFKGVGIFLRLILNFICGIFSIFFLYILVPIAMIKGFINFLNRPISEQEVKEYNKERENSKRRVEFNYYTDEDGNSGLATTYHHTDHFSSTTYTDKDGEKHIIYNHKH